MTDTQHAELIDNLESGMGYTMALEFAGLDDTKEARKAWLYGMRNYDPEFTFDDE